MKYLEFMFESWQHFFGIAIIISGICTVPVTLWDTFNKSMNIRANGYPPLHCNALGDLINEEEDEDII